MLKHVPYWLSRLHKSFNEVFFQNWQHKKNKLFSSSLTQHSTLIRLLPPSFFLMYNLSTSLIGCNFPYIVTFSLDFLSTFFNSLPFHCSIPVPYLNRTTVYVFIAVVLFFPLSFHFRINRSLRFIYSFIVFFFFSFHPLWSYPTHLYSNMCIL